MGLIFGWGPQTHRGFRTIFPIKGLKTPRFCSNPDLHLDLHDTGRCIDESLEFATRWWTKRWVISTPFHSLHKLDHHPPKLHQLQLNNNNLSPTRHKNILPPKKNIPCNVSKKDTETVLGCRGHLSINRSCCWFYVSS